MSLKIIRKFDVVLLIIVVLMAGFFVVEKIIDHEVVTDNTSNWKIYQNEKYGLEIKYPDFLTPINRTGERDDFYRNSGEHQYITFRTSEQISWMGKEEFPFPTFAILITTGFSVERWVDRVIGCQNEVIGYADLCVEHGDITGQLINGMQFVTFHEPGPVDGVYHYVARKSDLLIDVQTFIMPNEESLKVRDVLNTLKIVLRN